MKKPDLRRRYTAAVLLGLAGASIMALGQREAGGQLNQLLAGSRPEAPAGRARRGSIMATAVLAEGRAGLDWGSDSLRDAVAGASPAPALPTGFSAFAKGPATPRPAAAA